MCLSYDSTTNFLLETHSYLPSREGLLLHIAIGVSQCQLTCLFEIYVHNLLCYPLKPRQNLELWWSGRYAEWDSYSKPCEV